MQNRKHVEEIMAIVANIKIDKDYMKELVESVSLIYLLLTLLFYP